MKIAQLGQPVLRRVADPVPLDQIASPEFQKLLDGMLETIIIARGAGLAAPQVFTSLRVFLAGVLPPKILGRDPEIEAFINPQITVLTDETTDAWEGCLSFRELLVVVTRPTKVRIDYIDRQGQARSLELEDFKARIVLHEYDHLDGILTLDHAKSTLDIVKASEIDDVRAARGEIVEKDEEEHLA